MTIHDTSGYFTKRRGSVREGLSDALDTEVVEVRSCLNELPSTKVVLPSMYDQPSPQAALVGADLLISTDRSWEQKQVTFVDGALVSRIVSPTKEVIAGTRAHKSCNLSLCPFSRIGENTPHKNLKRRRAETRRRRSEGFLSDRYRRKMVRVEEAQPCSEPCKLLQPRVEHGTSALIAQR